MVWFISVLLHVACNYWGDFVCRCALYVWLQ